MKSVFGYDQTEDIMIPKFDLAAADVGRVDNQRFYLKHNLVVFLVHNDCDFCPEQLKMINDLYDRYAANNAEVIAVSAALPEELEKLSRELNLKYPLLSDGDGRQIAVFMRLIGGDGQTPAVLVFDRYGALQGWETSGEVESLPDQEEILDKLFYIETQCPECGVYP